MASVQLTEQQQGVHQALDDAYNAMDSGDPRAFEHIINALELANADTSEYFRGAAEQLAEDARSRGYLPQMCEEECESNEESEHSSIHGDDEEDYVCRCGEYYYQCACGDIASAKQELEDAMYTEDDWLMGY
jgi:hypothetical protein